MAHREENKNEVFELFDLLFKIDQRIKSESDLTEAKNKSSRENSCNSH